MYKILAVARREFSAMVATKAFLLSITLMPVLMFGGLFFASKMKDMVDTSDRRIVIVDGTDGEMFAILEQAAEARNAALDDLKNADPSVAVGDDEQPPARFVLERHEQDHLDDHDRLALSDQVRNGALKAFVEIPPKILDDAAERDGVDSQDGDGAVEFYASAAMFSPERGWLESTINSVVRARRFEAMDLDPEIVAQATADAPFQTRGLLRDLGDGRIGGGEDTNPMIELLLPFGCTMLLFMVVMLAAQPMLESVMEEKGGRIAEMLLGSVNSFHLMLGKLAGNVFGSLSALAVYAVGAYAVLVYNDMTDYIPWDLVPWFVIYQVLAVLFFGSIFMGVGAAVSQLKEAQSMLLPVWLLMCIPLFVWLQIVREPNGPLATALSFFPPATPMVMVLRLAAEETVPGWQVAATIALLSATTLAVTYLAARVFRIGMLWQGKTPKLGEIARWALSG